MTDEILNIWVEKYRPQNLDDFVGNENLKLKLQEYIDKQEISNLLFFGKPGTGKTTIARILCKSIDCDYLVLNASDERGIDTIREKITNFASIKSYKKIKIIVLEEADNMTDTASKAFKVILEDYYKTTRFILTTNHYDRIYEPILSRLQQFEFRPQSFEDVVNKCKYILKNENISYKNEDLEKIIKGNFPDLRSIIGNLQKNSINGELRISKEYLLQSQYQNVMLAILKKGEKDSIDKIKEIFSMLRSIDYVSMYDYLFNNSEKYARDKLREADILLSISEYLYRDNFISNKSLNFMACLIDILQKNK